jgi:hypothetical protein
MTTPTLLVVGAEDKQIDPKRVEGFEASLEWLEKGTVRSGQTGGIRN